jgi:hypothetical protein
MKNTVKEVSDVVDTEMLIEDMQRKIAAAELRRARLSRGMVHTQDGRACVTEEMSGMRWIDQMEKIARRIADRDGSATKMVKHTGLGGRGELRCVLTPLGEAIWELCKEAVPLMEQLYPGCQSKDWRGPEGHHPERQGSKKQGVEDPLLLQPPSVDENPEEADEPEGATTGFNPYISVLLRACQNLRSLLGRHGYVTLDVNQRFVRNAAERLVRFVRRVCHSKRFRYLENNYVRKGQENLESCCEYVAKAFWDYSKLLIIRVDLYFLPDAKGWADTLEASESFRRFRRALREGRIVPDVKAWICRRENGFRRGMHMHVFVAIDGHKHRDAFAYSKMICDAWVERYSAGHGSCFNCWARRFDYDLNCLGLVHISNREMLMGIREALRYMTKGACQVTTGYKRNLWKGIKRLSWSVIKRGAPRKLGHDMALVNEIIGCEAFR